MLRALAAQVRSISTATVVEIEQGLTRKRRCDWSKIVLDGITRQAREVSNKNVNLALNQKCRA